MPRFRAVSFDFGQTLAEIDLELLAARLAERDVVVADVALAAALPEAFATYDALVRAAGGGAHPWQDFMRTLLHAAGVPQQAARDLAGWLWTEQPRKNLWRRPIPGMIQLVRDLREGGVRVAILSNSEGHLAELVDELGWTEDFAVIGDSGRLGVEKPSPQIFAWLAQALTLPAEAIVHVGDARSADVEGALASGLGSVWFGPHTRGQRAPEGAFCAIDAATLRAQLVEWGLLSRPRPDSGA